ncbi:Folliculin-interacting protein 1 [Mactra antiquata]
MAFIQKLLNTRKFGRQNSKRSSYSEAKADWKKPQFEEKSIRLVLFQESEGKGRRIIFDSKCVTEDDKTSRWGRPGTKLNAVAEGQIQKNISNPKMHNYVPSKTGSDGKRLEEILYGAEGVAYKGTSLKVHVVKSPAELILTKVFIPEKPKRYSVTDEDFSSAPDLSMPRPISQESRNGIAQSIPVDVPSPRYTGNWMIKSSDLIDEESGLGSLNSSGSFQAPCPSPSSSSSGCNSLNRDRRLNRGQYFSLESCLSGRRRSQQDLLAELVSPNRSRKCKMALGIIFSTIDEHNEEANRLFENFFFSHIALFESHLEQLRNNVEKAYYSGNKHVYLSKLIESFGSFKRGICDLYTAPRLSEPVWLNMMAFSNYRYVLCDNFLKELVTLVTKFDNKNTNFFMSTLVTTVLTHHLAWIPTVVPAGGSPSATYLEKHSAKWVNTLAKSHPYNPLWAQLGDLYGAIGFPLKLSRTVIVGKKADIVRKILYVLSYFIRCSDILETTETGCLETYLQKLNFSCESPNDSDKMLGLGTPTPVNESNKSFGLPSPKSYGVPSPTPVNVDEKFKYDETSSTERSDTISFQSMGLDSLLGSNNTNSSGMDYNSNNSVSEIKLKDSGICEACQRNRLSQKDIENKVGNSVFYVNSDTCHCALDMMGQACLTDSLMDSDKKEHIQRKKDNLKLTLKIPGNESQSQITELNRNKTHSQELKECKLSMASIVENTRTEKVEHSKKCVDINIRDVNNSKMSLTGYDIKIPNNASKVLTHDEMKAVFLKKGSNSMFNEYFEDESAEAKTIDEIDEKDRVVDLPRKCNLRRDSSKAPSLPDLTAPTQGKGDSHRDRVGSLDQTYKFRRSSLSRQVSEANKNFPGRCRPVTPTELYKRRHISSTSSLDFDFCDPRSFCQELPLPMLSPEISCSSQKEFDKNFGRSLLGDYSDHYMSDFVLHGTSDKNYKDKIIADLRMALQYSVLDEPIAEAVCIVADTDTMTVSEYSSQNLDKNSDPIPCGASQLITKCFESVVSMAKLKMSPEFCVMHLEDRLQEIYFKSKMMAECLKNRKLKELYNMFGFHRSDVPLLVAIAEHTRQISPILCVDVPAS